MNWQWRSGSFACICQVLTIQLQGLPPVGDLWHFNTFHDFLCLSCKANAPPFILALFLLSNAGFSVYLRRCRSLQQPFHRESDLLIYFDATKSHRGLRFCVSPHCGMAQCPGWSWLPTHGIHWHGDIHHAHEKHGHVPARIDKTIWLYGLPTEFYSMSPHVSVLLIAKISFLPFQPQGMHASIASHSFGARGRRGVGRCLSCNPLVVLGNNLLMFPLFHTVGKDP